MRQPTQVFRETSFSRVLRRAYSTVDEERSARLQVLEGQLPSGLRGTLYRNGPGGLGPDSSPLDADGLVVRIAFTPEGVDYRHRYVQTQARLEERRAGTRLHRTFSVNRPGGALRNMMRVRLKNTANTHVVFHAGDLLALWEGGQPHRLHPETLETLGPFDFYGRLWRRALGVERVLSPELPFSAHPRKDRHTGVLYNFGVASGFRNQLFLYEVSPGGHMAEPRPTLPGRMPHLHDFMLTARHYAFLVPPTRLALMPMALGLASPAACTRRDPKTCTELLLVRRDTFEELRLPAGQDIPLHFINGYEPREGMLVLDAFCSEAPFDPGHMRDWLLDRGSTPLPRTYLVRFEADLERGRVVSRRLSERSCEFPAIHPGHAGERHRFLWALGLSPEYRVPVHTALYKLDVDSGAERVRDLYPDLPSEPVFVPREDGSGEDAGWLLVIVYRSAEHASELWVLDAGDLRTVCRLRLPQHLPPGIHGCWVPRPDSTP